MMIALRRLSLDPEAILAAAGYGGLQLEGAVRLVPFGVLRSLALGLPNGGADGLALQIGAQAPVTAHGAVGVAMIASDTLGEALATLAQFGGARGRSVRFTYAQGADYGELSLTESFDLGDMRPFVLEAAAVHVSRLIAAVAGEDLEGVVYEFPYPAPSWAAAYQPYLPGCITFGAPALRLRVPRAHLTLPSVTADPVARKAALRQCEREAAEIDLAAKRDLLPWLHTRLDEAAGDYPGLAAAAQELDISPRTLIRRLKAKGLRYRDLVDEARAELAGWRLAHTSNPIEQIAVELGYGDPSNFSRTFRRWRGVTPSDFRRRAALAASTKCRP